MSISAEMEDTIAAVATPMGEGGIGIVRVSGPGAVSLVDRIFRSPRGRSLRESKSWTLSYGWIVDAEGEAIDEVIVSVMRGPRSYTAEDVVEINCHGGIVPLRGVLERVLEVGARLAEPGEFTKRAFLHGRLDLSQAEAVIDLVRAKTERSGRVAVRQLEGNLAREIGNLRQELVKILAGIEAAIDYPDEVGDVDSEELKATIGAVRRRVREMLETADAGRVLREGVDTAIVGKPNVGKSSLLNLLLRQNRAIVTEVPGTTRDVIEEIVNIRGIPIKVRDTAGIRHTEDAVERIGVEKALALVEGADLVLCVVDGSCPVEEDDITIMRRLAGRPGILVVNKLDLEQVSKDEEYRQWVDDTPVVRISAKTGEGLEELEREIAKAVMGGQVQLTDNRIMVTRARHKQALKNALESLEAALNTVAKGLPVDLVAIDVQDAADSLGEVSGDTVREEVIDRIFADFCVGK